MILHIDMDAFFASVEQRDDPGLRGKPVVVGGRSERGVVAAASYEARAFGIHSAMPVFQARKRCRDLIIVRGDKHKYRSVSRQVMSILRQYTPLVEPVSIDEAFMDITGCDRLNGPPEVTATAIQDSISRRLDLTCSIGGAPVKFLAKIASDMKKPAGITLIPPDQVAGVIKTLAIEKVPGVGKRAKQKMDLLGIRTLGDVKRLNPELLNRHFGKFGRRLFLLARGQDRDRVDPAENRHSISSETTLSRDITAWEGICKELLRHSIIVGHDLRSRSFFGETVFVKFKFSDFSQITRQTKISPPTAASMVIYDAAVNLAGQAPLDKPIRLMGVGVSGLSHAAAPIQMDLFQSESKRPEKWNRIDAAMDAIDNRFGPDMITSAILRNKNDTSKP